MKKLLTLLFATMLVLSVFSILVSAEDTINPDGYKFDIKGINGTITGEDGIIITKQDAIESANLKWPIIIICQKVSDGVYKVKQAPINPKGNVPSITLQKDEIIIAIHSSSSDLTQKDKFKNVEQKVAAEKVQAGMYFTFEGIDLENGTCNNGKAVCSAKAPDGVSTPTESSAAASSAESSKATSSAATSSATTDNSKVTSSETKTNTSSAAENSKTASSVVTSEIETNSGLDTTTIIIIIAAVVVVAVVLAIIFTKKKK